MRRARRVTLMALAAAAVAPASAWALSCSPPPPPEQSAETVDAVFQGVALERAVAGVQRFRVRQVHKGDVPRVVRVHVGTGPWAPEHAVGETHALALERRDGRLHDGPCSKAQGGADAIVEVLER